MITSATINNERARPAAKPLSREKAIRLLNLFDFSVVTFKSGSGVVEGVTSEKRAQWFEIQMRAYGVYLTHVEGGYIIQNRG